MDALAAERSMSGHELLAEVAGTDEDAASWFEGLKEGHVSLYVFRCAECDRLVGHWDTD